MSEVRELPQPVKYRSGCKVGWEGYATLADAQAVVEHVREQAVRRAAQGYDFGWLTPGDISGPDADGLYWVTVP